MDHGSSQTSAATTDSLSSNVAVAVGHGDATRLPRVRGKTFIEDDVMAVIARTAAEQVQGIHQLGESNLRSLLSRFGKHRGVEAETGLKEAAVDVEVVVELGYSIRDVAADVREEVIQAIESMTDRVVVEVNVFVVDVHVPRSAARRHRRELE